MEKISKYLIASAIIAALLSIGCSPKLIGGEKDSHGCLIAAGYSWCEEKGKCLRTWEENCTVNETVQIANPASSYCISKGGKLNIVTAEDGSQTGMCTLADNTVCEEWAYLRGECFSGIYSCLTDSDCTPKPGCHPKECINTAYSNKFNAPDACTMMFDCSAAYSKADCLCVNNICTNKNLGNKGCEEPVAE
ncbi:MAG: DUF333 domain-containing protein [Candidatus Woesearchaeota archaeon]|nr:DUF333 domain-containing protein [Candidatus Woesearchaeota archaeon]